MAVRGVDACLPLRRRLRSLLLSNVMRVERLSGITQLDNDQVFTVAFGSDRCRCFDASTFKPLADIPLPGYFLQYFDTVGCRSFDL